MKKPSKSVTACEEFFLLVVEARILTAAMQVFGMSTLEDKPSTQFFPENSSRLNPAQRRHVFLLAIRQVLDKFVEISFPVPDSNPDTDHVQAYAKEVMSLGLLLMEFVDAIREGDGLRILRCWRFFLPIFKSSNRTNYSIEAFTLLAQYEFLLTPRIQEQLLWNRTVNTRGRPGKNVPSDLHMEHINRECKNAIGHLGPNIGDRSVSRVGKSIGELTKVTAQFDEVNKVPAVSEKHSKRSAASDLEKMLKHLHEDSRVFQTEEGRQHNQYPAFQTNMTRGVDRTDLNVWMNERFQELVMHQ